MMSDAGGATGADAPSPIRAIVAGHGEFAAGLVSAVAQIAGQGDQFLAFTNRGMSAADVEREMRAALERTGAIVIFTDLPAGSCTMAARRIQRDRGDILVVTGTNLATLLDFSFPSGASPQSAVQHAVEKGRASLLLTGHVRGA
jgi:N-acetylgalactosamine PTS system EIIA component